MDKEFNKPLRDILYYNTLNKKLEQEVGDFLRSKTNSPKLYSNDIRHQYTSAMYGRNKGEDKTRLLGKLNEIFNISEAEPYNRQDKAIDLYNNDIGIQYGLQYPNVSKQQLLEIMFNDYNKNKTNRINKLGY